MLDLNIKIGQKIKIIGKLKTKIINIKASIGSGSTVLDASNEIIRRQSTIRDFLTYVLTFIRRVTGAERILV